MMSSDDVRFALLLALVCAGIGLLVWFVSLAFV